MVCVSISHSGSSLAPRGGFYSPPKIYLYWPLHGISHFRVLSGTSCCTSTQWDCKRPHTKTPGNWVQSSFQIPIIEQQEGVSVPATKRGAQEFQHSRGQTWQPECRGVVSGCCWSSESVLASSLTFFSSLNFTFCGQKREVSVFLFEIHNHTHSWPSLTWMLASAYTFSCCRNHAGTQSHCPKDLFY